MLKTCFLTKNAFFHPNLRTLNMHALASFGFGFRRSNISNNGKISLCIRQNHVLVEFQTIRVLWKTILFEVSRIHLMKTSNAALPFREKLGQGH